MKRKAAHSPTDEFSDVAAFNELLRKNEVLVKWLSCFTDLRNVLQNYFETLRPILGAKEATDRMMNVVTDIDQVIKPIEHLLDEYDRYLLMINSLSANLAEVQEVTTEFDNDCVYRKKVIRERLLPPSSKRLLARNGGTR